MAREWKIPVRERALRALQARLENINWENGYNSDVKQVIRSRVVPTPPTQIPSIFIMIDESTVAVRGTNHEIRRVGVDLWFVVRSGDNVDQAYNLLLADIQKATAPLSIYDTNHPITNAAEVCMREQTDTPLYWDRHASFVWGKVRYLMEYTQLADDPFRWDGRDNQLVEVW